MFYEWALMHLRGYVHIAYSLSDIDRIMKMEHWFRENIIHRQNSENIYFNKSHTYVHETKRVYSLRFLEHFKITPTTGTCRQFPLSWKTIRLCLARKNFTRFQAGRMVFMRLLHCHSELCCSVQTIQYSVTEILSLHTFHIYAKSLLFAHDLKRLIELYGCLK